MCSPCSVSPAAGPRLSARWGEKLKQAVEEVGIDTRNLLMDPSVRTTLAFVSKKPNGDRDFAIYRNPGADMQLCAGEVQEELIASRSQKQQSI